MKLQKDLESDVGREYWKLALEIEQKVKELPPWKRGEASKSAKNQSETKKKGGR